MRIALTVGDFRVPELARESERSDSPELPEYSDLKYTICPTETRADSVFFPSPTRIYRYPKTLRILLSAPLIYNKLLCINSCDRH